MMIARTVPENSMSHAPISGLQELQAHLQQVQHDSSLPFDAKLLDDVELQLTEDNIPPLLPTLLPALTDVLKSTSQDPTPVLSLTIKLLSPLSFVQTLTIADPPSLLTALNSPLPGANLLALAIIRKAAHSASDASTLSTHSSVVEALVRCWLASPDVGVGERAARVLGDLLETDADTPAASQTQVNGFTGAASHRGPGRDRLWPLIFLSRPNLSLIYEYCTADLAAGSQPRRSTRQITISQGRLLRLLPRLCTLNMAALSRPAGSQLCTLPEAVADQVGHGLLQWAALQMVDASDVLMHLSLVDFFETLVSIMRVSAPSAEADLFIGKLVKTAIRHDDDLANALQTLPDRTVEEEAEPLRAYVTRLLS